MLVARGGEVGRQRARGREPAALALFFALAVTHAVRLCSSCPRAWSLFSMRVESCLRGWPADDAQLSVATTPPASGDFRLT